MINSIKAPSKIRDLLKQGMGVTTHWFPSGISIEILASTLIGMANAEGGIVLVGISPRSGHVQGVRDPKIIIDDIFQASLLADPALVLPLPKLESIEGKMIVKVVVPRGLPYVYNLDGRYLIRIGSRAVPLVGKELRKLLMERGVIQFETRVPPGATMDDIDKNQVSHYITAMKYPDNKPVEDVLLQRGCVKWEKDVLRPTYSGILLFGKNPQQWLPSAIILAARFPSETLADEFIKREIHGTLPDQIRQAEVFLRNHLQSDVNLDGLTRKETYEYPLEVIRELIVNAVSHRDYNLQGDGIHLHLFSNRLEVHSPGGLPGPVNLNNLLEARFSRNAVITQVLSDFGFVERLGYGLNRVVTVLSQHDLPLPIFKEIGGSFRVIIQNTKRKSRFVGEPKDLSHYSKYNLNHRQEKALTFLAKYNRITNSNFQQVCPDVSQETIRRDLVDMVRKGILIKIGDKKSTYYILK